MFFLLWFSPTVGEDRLLERLRIYRIFNNDNNSYLKMSVKQPIDCS